MPNEHVDCRQIMEKTGAGSPCNHMQRAALHMGNAYYSSTSDETLIISPVYPTPQWFDISVAKPFGTGAFSTRIINYWKH